VLVVDTSAVVAALVARPPDQALVDRLAADGDLHAPHLLDVELLHALRGLVLAGQLSEDRAADARADFADLTVVRYGHAPLADRAWELGDNLTAYDATFVALAEALNVPLVTCDARLAGATGSSAVVELYEGAGS
jgi:predicted nucleic acid-binding protein